MISLWIILLSIIGLVISGYIAISHVRNKKVVCPINSRSCNAVLDSDWSNILGLRNELIGLAYYLSIIIGLILINNGYSTISSILRIAATVSTLYSVFLMMIQVRILKEFCFYCFCTTIVNIALFILLVQ